MTTAPPTATMAPHPPTAAQTAALQELEAEFAAPQELLCNVVHGLHKSMDAGLMDMHSPRLAMLPSFIVGNATGSEQGRCLALDLGGTNFRVCEVVLKGRHGEYSVRQQKFPIPQSLKTAPAAQLNAFIADGIATFLRDHALQNEDDGNVLSSSPLDLQISPSLGIPVAADAPVVKQVISLGYTFSFPVYQRDLCHGELVQWNKGFNCPGAVGQDVVAQLQLALEARQIHVQVTALLNDTVGALVACSYRYPNTVLGAILGTGSNTAYMEKVARIPKLQTQIKVKRPDLQQRALEQDLEMVVNMEWGGFDNPCAIVPLNRYDQRLDEQSNNQGKQMFEKRISGLYLGELFRLVVVDYIKSHQLFGAYTTVPDNLTIPYALDTSVVSRLVDDDTPNLVHCAQVIKHTLGLNGLTPTDHTVLRRIAAIIAWRSARLAGAGLGAVVLRRRDRLEASSPENPLTIGIDGSLFEHFKTYRTTLLAAMTEIIGQEHMPSIRIALTKDGSGVGAAVAAIMSAEGSCL